MHAADDGNENIKDDGQRRYDTKSTKSATIKKIDFLLARLRRIEFHLIRVTFFCQSFPAASRLIANRYQNILSVKFLFISLRSKRERHIKYIIINKCIIKQLLITMLLNKIVVNYYYRIIK